LARVRAGEPLAQARPPQYLALTSLEHSARRMQAGPPVKALPNLEPTAPVPLAIAGRATRPSGANIKAQIDIDFRTITSPLLAAHSRTGFSKLARLRGFPVAPCNWRGTLPPDPDRQGFVAPYKA